jgi:hypothetical protein
MTDTKLTEERVEELRKWLSGDVANWTTGIPDEQSMVAALLRLLDQHKPAPSLMDLRGIAPDITGDLSSEEFVRRIREGWTPPQAFAPATPAPDAALPDAERAEMVDYLDVWWSRFHDVMIGENDCRLPQYQYPGNKCWGAYNAIRSLILSAPAPRKCDKCPFGSTLKEYEEDDLESDAQAEPTSGEPIQIVFDGPPEHEAGRFVEVEQGGKSINFGEWKHRDDGFWVLELPLILSAPAPRKVVSREWVEKTAREVVHLGGRLLDEEVDYLSSRLRDLGLEIGPEAK